MDDLIGLIPAAGTASRLPTLPCSKEIFPIGFQSSDPGKSKRPKAVCEFLLNSMRAAGMKRAFIVVRDGKWDILSFLKSGKEAGVSLSYLIMQQPFGVPYTLDGAYPFIKNEKIMFGFPDIIFQPKNAYLMLLEQQIASNADIVLGLFPTHFPQKADMVALDSNNQIVDIAIKQNRTDLSYAWIIAVWSFQFTRFMHDFVATHRQGLTEHEQSSNCDNAKEIFLGDVIKAAINEKLVIDSIIFKDGFFFDIGTPEELEKAVNYYTKQH